MPGAVATFIFQTWIGMFPEFAQILPQQAQGFFNQACIYLRNDGGSPVTDPGVQTTLLYLLTAHIAARYVQSQGDATPGAPKDANTPVGRLADVAEGSVSASFQNDYPAGTAQWYQTTKYGSDYWAATAQYRTMRYAVGCSRPARGFPVVYPGPYGRY